MSHEAAIQSRTASTVRVAAVGQFIMRDSCYVLRRTEGEDLWLELDRIPQHLIDRPVRVEGTRYPGRLMVVDRIGPA